MCIFEWESFKLNHRFDGGEEETITRKWKLLYFNGMNWQHFYFALMTVNVTYAILVRKYHF